MSATPVSEALWYFIYLQMFGSGHRKSSLLPDPQQEEFQTQSVMCQANLSIYRLMIATLIKTHLNMCIFICDPLPRNVGSGRAVCGGHVKWLWLWGRWESSIVLIFCSQKGPSLPPLITSLWILTADSRFLISFYPRPKRTTGLESNHSGQLRWLINTRHVQVQEMCLLMA